MRNTAPFKANPTPEQHALRQMKRGACELSINVCNDCCQRSKTHMAPVRVPCDVTRCKGLHLTQFEWYVAHTTRIGAL